MALTPDVWFEMILEPYPTAAATTYRWAPRPYADSGSWKEGRLVSMGPIERALSDDDGHYNVSTTRVVLDDQDGLLRGLLSTQATSYFTGREAAIKLLSEAGRRAGTTPRTLFRGRVQDVQLLPNRQVSIDVRDLVGSSFSSFDLDKTIGVPIGAEHTELPESSKGKIYPLIYGEHSDRGALDENGDSAEKGMLPVIDSGNYHPFGEDIPTTYVSPPQNLTATKVGSRTGTRTRYWSVSAKTNFGQTTASNIVSLSNLPDSLDSSTYVLLEWDPPAVGAEYVIAYPVHGRSTNPPTKTLDIMNNGGTFVNPETEYRDGRQGTDTDYDSEKSPGPPLTNTAELEGTNMSWGRLVVAIGAVDVRQVFGSDLADGSAPKRTELDIDGSDICTSRSAAWPHPDPYIEVGGIRQTVIYARGPRLEAHRNGDVTFAVNACGYEDVGDGSGTMISQAFYQWQHLINEHILKDEGTGYRTGTWGPLETYSNGNAQIQTSKFTAAQALSIARIGGLGYLGAIAIHEAITVRELVRRFNLTFDAFLGVNHHGQIIATLIDERAAATAGRLYHEFEIIDLGEQRFDHDAIETKVTYSYDWDSDSQVFRVLDRVVEDTTAGEALKGARFGEPQELFYTRDGATAYDTRLRRIFRRRRAPRYVAPKVNLVGVEDDLADLMRFTHYNGLGSDGDVNTPGFIRRHRIENSTVTLEMLDLRRMGTMVTAGAGASDGSGSVLAAVRVPTATISGGVGTQSAGVNGIAMSVPPAVLVSDLRQAGVNAIVATAPTAYIKPLFAGRASLALVAPTAQLLGEEDMIIRKTSDESVTSSTGMQSDDHLVVPIGANETWAINYYLGYTAATGGDITVGVNVPTGASGRLFAKGLDFAATGSIGSISVFSSTDLTDGGAGSWGGAGATAVTLEYGVLVQNSTSAGNVTLRWTQRVSSGTATTMLANSFLRATRST